MGTGFRGDCLPKTNKEIVHLGFDNVLSEACFPVKVAHGHIKYLVDAGIDAIFIPSFIDISQGGAGSSREWHALIRRPSLMCPKPPSAVYGLSRPLWISAGAWSTLAENCSGVLNSLESEERTSTGRWAAPGYRRRNFPLQWTGRAGNYWRNMPREPAGSSDSRTCL